MLCCFIYLQIFVFFLTYYFRKKINLALVISIIVLVILSLVVAIKVTNEPKATLVGTITNGEGENVTKKTVNDF